MIFLVMAFLLSRKARWSIAFTIVTLLCGTVPVLSFWAEHRATAAGAGAARGRAAPPRPPSAPDPPPMAETAFVLGGGGLLGAVEVGMLRALLEARRPARPDPRHLGRRAQRRAGRGRPGAAASIDRLVGLWESAASSREVYGDGPVRQVSRAVRTGTHLHSAKPLRDRLAQELGDLTFAELAVPFQCCAASIERAAEHWFTQGRVDRRGDGVRGGARAAAPGARSTASTTSTAAS